MKYLLPTLALLLGVLAARAQTPAWHDAQHLDDYAGIFNPYVTATDTAGNVYLAGGFEYPCRMGGTTLQRFGEEDAYVAKWSAASHRIVWAVGMGGGRHDYVSAIVVKGNLVYVAGTFSEKPQGFERPLKAIGYEDVFLTRLTDHGTRATVDWTQQLGYPGRYTGANYLALDGSALYVAGTTITAPDSLSTETGKMVPHVTGFVTKVTDAGPAPRLGWTREWKPVPYYASLVALAAYRGKVYLLTNTWEPTPPRVESIDTRECGALSWQANYRAHLTRFSDEGATYRTDWTHTEPGAATALAVAAPALYLVGRADANLPFGAAAQPATAQDVAGDMLVAKLLEDDTGARPAWVQRLRGTGYDQSNILNQVAVRGRHVYVAGTFGSKFLKLGNTELTNAATDGASDLLVAELTDTGATARFDWAQRAGGPHYDTSGQLTVTARRLFFDGYFQDSPVVVGGRELTKPYEQMYTFFQAWLPGE